MQSWIGVDLDGTLAHYDKWQGIDHIGEPIVPMLERVKRWIADGNRVKIFTARVCETAAIEPIQVWLTKHGIGHLEITNMKDFGMVELWDDRCVQVTPNTGEAIGVSRRGLK